MFQPPNTRSEFERRLNLLHAAINRGRFILPEGALIDSIARIRRLANGRIDFLSVDEFARLNANTISHFLNSDLSADLKIPAHEDRPEISDDPE